MYGSLSIGGVSSVSNDHIAVGHSYLIELFCNDATTLRLAEGTHSDLGPCII